MRVAPSSLLSNGEIERRLANGADHDRGLEEPAFLAAEALDHHRLREHRGGPHPQAPLLADTQRVVAAFPPDVATLRVLDGTDHNSVSGEADFWEALVTGK
jgi:hypothetical protein